MTDPSTLHVRRAELVPGAPVRLDESDLDTICEFLAAGRAPNTMRGYRSDLRTFEAWCRSKGGSPRLPIRPEVVAAYLGHLAKLGRRWATIERHMAAISAVHEAADKPTLVQARIVRSMCKGLRRKLGVTQDRVEPLLPADLTKIVERAPRTLRWRRNVAMLTLGFAGALRRSELVAVRVEHLHEDARTEAQAREVIARRLIMSGLRSAATRLSREATQMPSRSAWDNPTYYGPESPDVAPGRWTLTRETQALSMVSALIQSAASLLRAVAFQAERDGEIRFATRLWAAINWLVSMADAVSNLRDRYGGHSTVMWDRIVERKVKFPGLLQD